MQLIWCHAAMPSASEQLVDRGICIYVYCICDACLMSNKVSFRFAMQKLSAKKIRLLCETLRIPEKTQQGRLFPVVKRNLLQQLPWHHRQYPSHWKIYTYLQYLHFFYIHVILCTMFFWSFVHIGHIPSSKTKCPATTSPCMQQQQSMPKNKHTPHMCNLRTTKYHNTSHHQQRQCPRYLPEPRLPLYSAFHALHPAESPFGDVKLKAVWIWELNWWISEKNWRNVSRPRRTKTLG